MVTGNRNAVALSGKQIIYRHAKDACQLGQQDDFRIAQSRLPLADGFVADI